MKNHRFKRVVSFLLAVIMIVAVCPMGSFAAETEPFNVVVSVEGLTLGQGIYYGPEAYTLDEINALVGTKGFGPYTEDTLTASMATLAFFVDNNIEYTNTGSWDQSFYLSGIKGVDTGVVDIPAFIGEAGGPTNEDNIGNDDEYLGEFDYGSMSGWMITCNNVMIPVGAADWELKPGVAGGTGENYGNTYNVRWHFTVHGYGADLGHSTGWGNSAMFEAANKDRLYAAYAKSTDEAAKAAALPVMENLTASQQDVDAALEKLNQAAAKPEQPHEAQDISDVLQQSMAQLATKVSAPAFGSIAGEWTVLSLARGEYYEIDNPYFKDYYDRIVNSVNTLAAKVPAKNGALHKAKSTDNSRLIMALSSIGKNATSVGDWNLIAPFDDFKWIRKQGINGPIFALIALDTHNYETTDTTIRQQCVDYILSKELADGGWALSGSTSDPDITAMALQALVRYKDQPAVATAAEKAFAWLSSAQNEQGGYASWGTVNSESISQVITACTAWGINADTDSRFVKNGKSAVDALLSFYDAQEKGFRHVMDGTADGMATDQAIYALISYDRLVKGKTALYDMSDVTFEGEAGPVVPEQTKLTASLGAPEKIENIKGTEFNAVVGIDGWDNAAGYKLIDFIVTVPKGLTVKTVTAGDRLAGGEVSYHLEKQADGTGKLRVVYFDPNANTSITVSGTEFPADLFQIGFAVEDLGEEKYVNLAISGMSVKLNSDSSSDASMVIVSTENAAKRIELVEGISFSAACLYQGDDVDLIPANKKAVVVTATGMEPQEKLMYNDQTNQIEFLHNEAVAQKTGMAAYVALVDASIPMEQFANVENYEINADQQANSMTFGDANADGVINAQDALAAVDAWLRKGNAPTDTQILALNVNGDSRINTFDALGIVEGFVNNTEFAVVTKAAIPGVNHKKANH